MSQFWSPLPQQAEPGSQDDFYIYDDLNGNQILEFETKEYANGTFPPSIISNGPMLVIEFEGDSVINTLKRKFKVRQNIIVLHMHSQQFY